MHQPELKSQMAFPLPPIHYAAKTNQSIPTTFPDLKIQDKGAPNLAHSRRRPIKLLTEGTNLQARYSEELTCQRVFFMESGVGDHRRSKLEGSHQDEEASITMDWQKGG